jgi:nitroimidazol reductase NimA-like FMN-containing flavoprotein (pyridoxamine 5'-phosphate oxidase superfamily)
VRSARWAAAGGDDELRELGERECVERLATQVVGRIAVVVDGEARVFPVNYLFDHGDIVFRTDEGTKLDAARAGALATFEVDHSDPIYHTGWSVMATGHLEAVTDPHDLRVMEGLPVRAWGRAGQHWVRMPIVSISGRRVTGAEVER